VNRKMRAHVGSVRQVASAEFPTRWGKFQILGFERDFEQGGLRQREEALAMLMGDIKSTPPLLRVHSQCITGDALGSLRCDCGQQLQLALSIISQHGAGVLIYEEQEGRGIGLMAKLQAYQLQDQGLDTLEANEQLGLKPDYRDYVLPVQILKALGIARVRLLSNNLDKVSALNRAGIEVVERISCQVNAGPDAEEYMRTKKEKFGHLLSL
jgi:GTP cyclohydrolase II